jgi:hypothetical protein
MQTSSAAPNPFNYRRHEPEKTLLYQVVAREWETWHAERQADTSRSPLPEYVAREMDAYLRCGILDHGFLILSARRIGPSIPSPVNFASTRAGNAACKASSSAVTRRHLRPPGNTTVHFPCGIPALFSVKMHGPRFAVAAAVVDLRSPLAKAI